MARLNNEALAAACARYPDRFVPLASVPLQDPPAPRLSYNALPAGIAWCGDSAEYAGARPG